MIKNHQFIPLINILFLLILSLQLPGQTITQSVRGQAIDEVSDIPLIGAEVYMLIDGEWKGTTTDVNGEFLIESAPIGRQSIYCRYLGYEDNQISQIEITSGKSPYITIRMSESIQTLVSVEITAEQDKAGTINPSALISARTFSMDEASRFAGSFNDPARMAQSFAGAASPDDESNEIIIRGNSPRGVLWRLQGLEIPNPNHYRDEGGSGGAVNIIPDIILSNSDFFTGAFPAEYGNALSGVFDLNLRKGNSADHEIALQAGFLGLQAAIEGPISEKNQSSYLFNYRYSTVSVLEEIGLEFSDEDEMTPVFQDAALNLNFPNTQAGNFNIYGLWGKSTAGSKPSRDSSKWLFNEQRYIFDESYITGVIGLNHSIVLSNNQTSINSAISFNLQADREIENYIQDDYSDLLLEENKYNYNTWRFKTSLKHKFMPQLHAETGILFDNLGFNINFGERLNNEYQDYLKDEASTQYIRWYGQLLMRPQDALTINAGIHIGYFALNEMFIPEPRIAASYKISQKSSISCGTGLHSKLEPISLYLARDFGADGSAIQRNKNLGLTKSWHHILGYDYSLSDHWRLKAEAYYQHMFNVPVLPNEFGGFSALNFSSGFTNEQLINVGKGRNLGMELTLEKFLHNGHFVLFTSSFFDSKYKDTNDQWIDTRYNIKFTANLLSGKEWPVGRNKNNNFGINGRLIMHGGLRYTPANEEASIENGYVILDYDQAYAYQLPNFFRFDASIKYRKNKPKWSWVLSLDVQNVMNRNNVYSRNFSVSRGEYYDIFQLGLLPVLNFRVEI